MKNYIQTKQLFYSDGCFRNKMVVMTFTIIFIMGLCQTATANSTYDGTTLISMTENSLLSQQQPTVTGTVTDATGAPIPGVTVSVQGTNQGAITDADGKYTIEVPQGSNVLNFSFVGMVTQNITIGDQTQIDVVMENDVIGLEDVVVIGYGTQKRGMLTGAISEVKSDKLVEAPLSNVTQTLAGRLPGLVTKQVSGSPGLDDAVFSIRGAEQPLIIVDGVEGNFNRLNPNEIESITILKDAAAAIYGSRAGNGVVLVTTKRGQMGKPTINFNYAYTSQSNTRFLTPVSSGQFCELANEWTIQREAGSAPYTQEDIDKYYAGNDPNFPNTNWYDVVARDRSPMSEYNLSVAGGSEKVRYYSFIGMLDQQAFFRSNDGNYKRYNARFNLDANITDDFVASVDVSSMIGKRKFPQRAGDLNGAWFQDLWNCLPIYAGELPDPDLYPYTGGVTNLVAESERDGDGYQDTDNTTMKGSMTLEYTVPFIQGLSLKAFGNYTKDFQDHKLYHRIYKQYDYDYDSDTYIEHASASGSDLTETDFENRVITGQFSLNYQRTFTNHSITVLGVYEIIDYYSETVRASRSNFLNPDFDYLFGGSSTGMTNDGWATEMGRASLIGRLNYAFKNKYLLDATVRHDASAKFPSESRWGTFPSISLGWRLSEEDFIANSLSGLTNLKLRGGYSQTGNDAIGNFQYLAGYSFGPGMAYGAETQLTIVSRGLANPMLTWETLNITNIGLDFGLWANKLYGSVDIFQRLRDGIAGTREQSLPSTFGDVAPLENINSMISKGFEALLGTRTAIGDVNIEISANVSYNRAKWQHYDEPEYTDPDDIRVNKKTGYYVDRTIGYLSDGLFTSQEQIDALTFDADGTGNTTLRPGDINFIDLNGDGVLDWKDQDVIGSGGTPHWMFGSNINATYKGFDLAVLLQGGAGYSVYNSLNPSLDMGSPMTASKALYENRWTEENNDPNALVARIGSFANNKLYYTDYYMRPGQYLRLKVLTVGYTLPTAWMNAAGISSLRVYVAATNVFTFDKLKEFGVDPEAPSAWANSNERAEVSNTNLYNIQPQPRNGWYYPQQKTISLGVNLAF